MYCIFERILNAFTINDHVYGIRCLILNTLHIFDKYRPSESGTYLLPILFCAIV